MLIMTTKTLNRLVFGAILMGVSLFGRLAQATPVVMSVNYSASDPNIHIGSTITVYMSAVDSSAQLNLSVTASAVNSITLAGFDLVPLALNTFVYVTDSQRTWAAQYVGGGILQFGDGQLMGGQSGFPFSVADYNTLTNQTFRAYTGTVINGATSGAQITADLGSFASLQLRDDGLGSDVGGFQNGVWSQLYTVPDLGYSISNSRIFGGALLSSVLAGNAPFQSVVSFSLDGIRPDIKTMAFSTSKSNYNGILYISASSMGTTANSPTNAIGRFDIETNKRGCIVDIEIVTAPSNKKLPPIFIPPTAANQNGWKNWYGEDGSDVFVQDGVYQARLYIRDDNGVSGLTRTTFVSVISLKMDISNITLTPSGLNSEPQYANTIITSVNYDVTLSNDANVSIAPALSVLGWPNANFNTLIPATGIYSSLSSTVWTVPIERFLNPNGTVAIDFPSHDFNSGSDSDESLLASFRGDNPRQSPGGPGFTLADCYYGLPGGIGETATTSIPVNIGDGNKTNDWDDVQLFQIATGTSTAPLSMVANQGHTYVGATPSEGSYRLQLRAILAGMDVEYGASALAPDVKDKCASALAPPSFLSMPVHFHPSTDTSGGTSSGRGRGIFVEDSSVLFTVAKSFPPTSDTTAPVVVSTDPQNGTQVQPAVYGPNPLQILSAQVQDIETTVRAENTISFIQILDPTGADIGGTRSTSGGSPSNLMILYFRPFQAIRKGGIYKMVVNSCNTAGLCISKEFSFTLQDQTAPSVVGVELVSSTQATNINLTMAQTSPDGPVSSITEVWARLGMDPNSANTIDWDNSVLALRKIVGGAAIVEPLTRISPALGAAAPTDGRIKYRVDLPINVAGLYEVFLQTTSKDASGQRFGGPEAPFTYPRFTTIVDPNYLSILYPGGDPQIPAVTGLKTITVTTSANVYVTPSTSTIQAFVPDLTLAAMNPPSGFVAVNSSAAGAHALQFSVVGIGTLTQGMKFTYDPTTPVRFNLYYDDADLPVGVSETALVVLGFDGVSWTPVAAAIQNSSGLINNSFTIIPPLSTPAAYAAYGIFFAASAANVSPTPPPTPFSFASTRAFNPALATGSRMARFYYSDTLPRNVDVKIYDTAGVLIKELALGNGVSATDIFTDPIFLRSSYYFQWDGRNDSGALARNGLYLVRWRIVKQDGSVDTQTKLVALVK